MKKQFFLMLPILMLATACDNTENNKKIEKCIDQICDKVAYDGEKLYILTTLNVHSKDGQSVKMYSNHHVEIPAAEAIKITKNWDLNDIKLYTNSDQEIKEHEKDACDTLYNLNLYITSHDLEIVHQYEK